MISELLEKDHESLGEILQDLESVLRRNNIDWAFELLDLFWARLAVHIRAENVCLFPAILNASPALFEASPDLPSFAEAKTAIEKLRGDHNFFMERLGGAVKTIRELLGNPNPSSECDAALKEIQKTIVAVAERLATHNRLEEEQVYRWPVAILSSAELKLLRDALKQEIENLPQRFANLSM
ncbi:MAG TPA: hemerythrin domain-containing protein [Pyrinomonadaceae bacterium]|nr:hemerythrin domain-containing protein [Pyrinomonadaceae bacterium]